MSIYPKKGNSYLKINRYRIIMDYAFIKSPVIFNSSSKIDNNFCQAIQAEVDRMSKIHRYQKNLLRK
jgi:hypothetical protein